MTYTYPKDFKIKTTQDQLEILATHFPELKNKWLDLRVENTSEGLFLIPKWQLLGGTYTEALIRVLAAIESTRPLYNFRKSEMEKSKEIPEKVKMMKNLPDMMVLPGQFGEKWKGKSVETVRKELAKNEIPLGAYEAAIMLLTHPERFQSYEDLWLDCPGDSFDGDFSHAPIFRFHDGGVGFDARQVGYARGGYGSLSVFVPQLETRKVDSFEFSSLEARVKRLEEWQEKVTRNFLDI